jgi:putative SOS response-associated peptidase YedK
MCGRYSLEKAAAELGVYYNKPVRAETSSNPNYNVAPTQSVPVVTKNEIAEMKWGLVPAWANSGMAYSMINARAETLIEKATYKKPFLEGKRVLVPSTGFYEWRKPDKTPFFIHIKDSDLFSMAGLFIKGKDDLEYFTIITTAPNKLMEPFHDRMPVILSRDEEEHWLNHNDPLELLPMLDSYPANQMEAYEVSKEVGNVRNNYPELSARLII